MNKIIKKSNWGKASKTHISLIFKVNVPKIPTNKFLEKKEAIICTVHFIVSNKSTKQL